MLFVLLLCSCLNSNTQYLEKYPNTFFEIATFGKPQKVGIWANTPVVKVCEGVKISENEISNVDEVLMMKTGGINISSNPNGSEIFIDDKYVGLSPINIPEIVIGQHQIKASHEDYLTGIVLVYNKITTSP